MQEFVGDKWFCSCLFFCVHFLAGVVANITISCTVPLKIRGPCNFDYFCSFISAAISATMPNKTNIHQVQHGTTQRGIDHDYVRLPYFAKYKKRESFAFCLYDK